MAVANIGNSYFLCEKTDGIRCLLYCTQAEDGREIHYLIDRKNDYYFVTGTNSLHLLDFQELTDLQTSTSHTTLMLAFEPSTQTPL
jgi:hypothetical protein